MSSGENTSTLPKQSSRWGKFKAGMSKGASNMGSKMSKGIVKAKSAAVQKMGVQPTAEDPEILRAFDRLKATKTETMALAGAARGMYDHRLSQVSHLNGFSQTASFMRVDPTDQYAAFAKQMGLCLASTLGPEQDLLKGMLEGLVEPLEQFLQQVEAIVKIKWKVNDAKTQYDYALHNFKKSQNKPETTQTKLNELKQKSDAKERDLNTLREQFKNSVSALENTKNMRLLPQLESYWKTYVGYSKALQDMVGSASVKPVDRGLMQQLHQNNPPVIPSDEVDSKTPDEVLPFQEYTGGVEVADPQPQQNYEPQYDQTYQQNYGDYSQAGYNQQQQLQPDQSQGYTMNQSTQ